MSRNTLYNDRNDGTAGASGGRSADAHADDGSGVSNLVVIPPLPGTPNAGVSANMSRLLARRISSGTPANTKTEAPAVAASPSHLNVSITDASSRPPTARWVRFVHVNNLTCSILQAGPDHSLLLLLFFAAKHRS